MAIELKELKTKSGHDVLRASFIKEVTVRDAEQYLAQIVRGAKYDHWGHLVVGNITGVSGEVKKVLASQKPDPMNPPPVATVFESAITRMVAGLAMRLSENENTDTFKTEDDALAWLDGRLAEYKRKAAAKKK